MKASDIKEVKNLLEQLKKLESVRTCYCSLTFRFLWYCKSVDVSADSANLCLVAERKRIEERLKELGVEVYK